MHYNVTIVCDKCLKELDIPQDIFDPFGQYPFEGSSIFETQILEAIKEWEIPMLVKHAKNKEGHTVVVETPASDIKALCPTCKKEKKE